jgi:spore germination cell wall hydrolase CwlJ-like protein
MSAAIDPNTLLAVAVLDEARGEIPEGRAAVAQVILNRMRLRYQSDGTIAGTVLHPEAF